MVTLDIGFADITTYTPAGYPGFVVLRLADQGKTQVLEVMARVIEALASSPILNKLWVVDERRIRIRS